jgi:hypothetical protein
MRGTLGFRPRLRDALRPARRCLAAAPLDAVPVDRMTACGRAADFRVSSSRSAPTRMSIGSTESHRASMRTLSRPDLNQLASTEPGPIQAVAVVLGYPIGRMACDRLADVSRTACCTQQVGTRVGGSLGAGWCRRESRSRDSARLPAHERKMVLLRRMIKGEALNAIGAEVSHRERSCIALSTSLNHLSR